MPKVTYITPDGSRHDVEVENGYSVMEGAINNDIDGIVAECGGACACGTCHCFVDPEWLQASGTADAMEEAMLGMRPDRADNSRLSCQIQVSEAMDGMVVRLPEFQM